MGGMNMMGQMPGSVMNQGMNQMNGPMMNNQMNQNQQNMGMNQRMNPQNQVNVRFNFLRKQQKIILSPSIFCP